MEQIYSEHQKFIDTANDNDNNFNSNSFLKNKWKEATKDDIERGIIKDGYSEKSLNKKYFRGTIRISTDSNIPEIGKIIQRVYILKYNKDEKLKEYWEEGKDGYHQHSTKYYSAFSTLNKNIDDNFYKINDMIQYSKHSAFEEIDKKNNLFLSDFILYRGPIEMDKPTGLINRFTSVIQKSKDEIEDYLYSNNYAIFVVPFATNLLLNLKKNFEAMKEITVNRILPKNDPFLFFLCFSQFLCKLLVLYENNYYIPQVYADQILVSRLKIFGSNQESVLQNGQIINPFWYDKNGINVNKYRYLFYYPKNIVHFLSYLDCEPLPEEHKKTFGATSKYLLMFHDYFKDSLLPSSRDILLYYGFLFHLLNNDTFYDNKNLNQINYTQLSFAFNLLLVMGNEYVQTDIQTYFDYFAYNSNYLQSHQKNYKRKNNTNDQSLKTGFISTHYKYIMAIMKNFKKLLNNKQTAVIKQYIGNIIHDDSIKISKKYVVNIHTGQASEVASNEKFLNLDDMVFSDENFDYYVPTFSNQNFYTDYKDVVHFLRPKGERISQPSQQNINISIPDLPDTEILKYSVNEVANYDFVKTENTKKLFLEYQNKDIDSKIYEFLKKQTKKPLPLNKLNLFYDSQNQKYKIYLHKYFSHEFENIKNLFEKDNLFKRYLANQKYKNQKVLLTNRNIHTNTIKKMITEFWNSQKYYFYPRSTEYNFRQLDIIDLCYSKNSDQSDSVTVVEEYIESMQSIYDFVYGNEIVNEGDLYRISLQLCSYCMYALDKTKNENIEINYINFLSEHNIFIYKFNNEYHLAISNMLWKTLLTDLDLKYNSNIFNEPITNDDASSIMRFIYLLRSSNKKQNYNNGKFSPEGECAKPTKLSNLYQVLHELYESTRPPK